MHELPVPMFAILTMTGAFAVILAGWLLLVLALMPVRGYRAWRRRRADDRTVRRMARRMRRTRIPAEW